MSQPEKKQKIREGKMRSNFSMQCNNSRLREAFSFMSHASPPDHHVSKQPFPGVVFLAGIRVKHMWARLPPPPWALETSDLQSLIIPPEKSVSRSVFPKRLRRRKSGGGREGEGRHVRFLKHICTPLIPPSLGDRVTS